MTKFSHSSVQKAHSTQSSRRRLKIFFIGGAVLLLIGLVGWPYLQSMIEEQETKHLPKISADSINLDKKVVTNPKMVGVDGNNQPYTLSAASGEQQIDGTILLTELRGEIALKEGSLLKAESGKGRIASEKPDGIYLYDGVNITYDTNHHVVTKDAYLDFKKELVISSNPVEGYGPYGVASAQKLLFDYPNRRLTLQGNASLTVTSRR